MDMNTTQAYVASNNKAQAALGNSVECDNGPALVRIASRIRLLTDLAGHIAGDLSAHADRLHGPVPESNSAVSGTTLQCGQIPEVEAMIDRLEATLYTLGAAAQRNMGLA